MRSKAKTLIVLCGLAAVAMVFLSCNIPAGTENKTMKYKPLKLVIVEKGTEPPFSGEYVDKHDDGTYRCKRCGAALFSSAAKFNSHTGWPSFDQALPGAVKEIPDADGSRVEIVCANCGAHLGHVFRGEGFTPQNTRHCVNSISLNFEPAQANRAVAYFAGGCFWGVEYYFHQQPGVISVESGYLGGTTANPTYEQVCTGTTGHAESVRVTYDPTRVSYEQLAKLFFEIHDPTQVNRQGPDIGRQYRSAVFFANDEQKRVAQKLIDQLKAKGLRVATQLEPAGPFWKAEDYHQEYYFKTGKTPYCHFRVKRFD
jgi:peptide methionine sulfoxide reductase msrA/msrB